MTEDNNIQSMTAKELSALLSRCGSRKVFFAVDEEDIYYALKQGYSITINEDIVVIYPADVTNVYPSKNVNLAIMPEVK